MEMEIRKFSDLSSVRESTEEKRVSVSSIILIETLLFLILLYFAVSRF